MMQRLRAAALCLAIPAVSAAQDAPAPMVKAGQHVWLIADSGGQLEGNVDHITGTEIVIDTKDGLRTKSLSTVLRIEKPDSIWNGAAWGAGTGAAALVVIANIDGGGGCRFVTAADGTRTCGASPQDSSSNQRRIPIVAMVSFVGVGALIGALADASTPGRDIVWQRTSTTPWHDRR